MILALVPCHSMSVRYHTVLAEDHNVPREGGKWQRQARGGGSTERERQRQTVAASVSQRADNAEGQRGRAGGARARIRRHAERARDAQAAEEILRAGRVAHVAFAVDGQPYMLPMTYAYEDGWSTCTARPPAEQCDCCGRERRSVSR